MRPLAPDAVRPESELLGRMEYLRDTGKDASARPGRGEAGVGVVGPDGIPAGHSRERCVRSPRTR